MSDVDIGLESLDSMDGFMHDTHSTYPEYNLASVPDWEESSPNRLPTIAASMTQAKESALPGPAVMGMHRHTFPAPVESILPPNEHASWSDWPSLTARDLTDTTLATSIATMDASSYVFCSSCQELTSCVHYYGFCSACKYMETAPVFPAMSMENRAYLPQKRSRSQRSDSIHQSSLIRNEDRSFDRRPFRGRSIERSTPVRSGSASSFASNVSCRSCSATFARPDVRKRHENEAHSETPTGVICGGPAFGWGCGKKYKNNRSLKDHWTRESKDGTGISCSRARARLFENVNLPKSDINVPKEASTEQDDRSARKPWSFVGLTEWLKHLRDVTNLPSAVSASPGDPSIDSARPSASKIIKGALEYIEKLKSANTDLKLKVAQLESQLSPTHLTHSDPPHVGGNNDAMARAPSADNQCIPPKKGQKR